MIYDSKDHMLFLVCLNLRNNMIEFRHKYDWEQHVQFELNLTLHHISVSIIGAAM